MVTIKEDWIKIGIGVLSIVGMSWAGLSQLASVKAEIITNKTSLELYKEYQEQHNNEILKRLDRIENKIDEKACVFSLRGGA